MKNIFLAAAMICTAAASPCLAESSKALKFWNLTADTITELYAQPVGKTAWSGNLCLSDPDHMVEADERLSLPGLAAGTYDLRVTDKGGRRCVFHNVVIRADGPYAFSISEAQMKSCSPP